MTSQYLPQAEVVTRVPALPPLTVQRVPADLQLQDLLLMLQRVPFEDLLVPGDYREYCRTHLGLRTAVVEPVADPPVEAPGERPFRRQRVTPLVPASIDVGTSTAAAGPSFTAGASSSQGVTGSLPFPPTYVECVSLSGSTVRLSLTPPRSRRVGPRLPDGLDQVGITNFVHASNSSFPMILTLQTILQVAASYGQMWIDSFSTASALVTRQHREKEEVALTFTPLL